ncbi:hypothetical protein AKJ09_09447 [Labilithrix luteola]|uniref:Uncharacterized protein n=1 Tax=Labilithrix luteola TaxID=1391654 RepID=A0A0K1QAM0_9BACT|nr:hypothetical protein [Labilithrix luteola]AKV02784.1 hypothetical protein AKJ09_09447 [Labilithrix luteola]
MSRFGWFVSAVVLASIAVATEAHAATTSPIPSLSAMASLAPLKGAVVEKVPGISMKDEGLAGTTRWRDFIAATSRGYCLADSGNDGTTLYDSYRRYSTMTNGDLDLVRFVEKDGKASLERTRVHFVDNALVPDVVGRSSVGLVEVAKSEAGAVYAYRDGSEVVLVMKGVESGLEGRKVSAGASQFSSTSCSFGMARLDGAAGAVGQFRGTLPSRGTGKDKVTPRFLVDASVSKLARDKAPMLAVRVRVEDGQR